MFSYAVVTLPGDHSLAIKNQGYYMQLMLMQNPFISRQHMVTKNSIKPGSKHETSRHGITFRILISDGSSILCDLFCRRCSKSTLQSRSLTSAGETQRWVGVDSDLL